MTENGSVHYRLKVVWLCALMNKEIREKIGFKVPLWKRVLNSRKKYAVFDEIALWNTNGIKAFESFNDIELHVVLFATNMLHSKEEFVINDIQFHVLRDIADNLFPRIIHRIKSRLVNFGLLKRESIGKFNRRRIASVVNKIHPDVVHVIGAENIDYSLSVLDLSKTYPVIVQLQTLLSAPNVVNNYPNITESISYEKLVLEKVRFIGTTIPYYKETIQKSINPRAEFLELKLAVQEKVSEVVDSTKQFDFVYFSSNINKAGYDAIEAFSLAHYKHPEITLDIIGGYDEEFKAGLDRRITDLGLSSYITFEGRLPSHEDVINQVRKSKFALLPVRIDFIPSVIREAIANKLPVVTCITTGTPTLNIKRESVLLSEIADYQAMADNMIALIENDSLSQGLIENATITIEEMYNNLAEMEKWRKAYYEITT